MITAAELLAQANLEAGRAETDIDWFVKEWVSDLTIQGVFLEGEESVVLVDEQPNYLESAFTNLFKKINAITIVDTDDGESDPLTEISWQRYKERVAQTVSPGKPREYCRFNDTVFLWPKPDVDLYPSMNVSGTVHHADSTTIAYPDRFRKCGLFYMIFRIYAKYGYAETKGVAPFKIYEIEVEKIKANQSTKRVSTVGYNDI